MCVFPLKEYHQKTLKGKKYEIIHWKTHLHYCTSWVEIFTLKATNNGHEFWRLKVLGACWKKVSLYQLG